MAEKEQAVGDGGARYLKYYDETYKMPYFYDTVSGESLWELPSSVDLAKDVKDCSTTKD